MFSIASVVSGVISGTTGILDTISNGISAVGSFFNISWFSDIFAGVVNALSTVLKVLQGVLSLLSLAALIGQILVNLNYILSYLFSGNLVAVGIYVTNLITAIATYPSL